MNVVVVGGGIVGVASAYYLVSRGATVTLCEKSHIGAGSTGYGGGIRRQFSSRVNVELSNKSLATWNEFEERFGVDTRREEIGYLLLARTEETADQLRADVEMQNDAGVPSEFIAPERALEVVPGLHAENYVGAAYCETDQFVDPNLALQGYTDAARDAGVDIRVGVEVTDIVRSAKNDRVSHVETTDGRIDADYVVNAAGAWAGTVAELADVDLPIRSVLRRLLLVKPDSSYPYPTPLTMDLDTTFVFYPEDEETMVAGGQVGELIEVSPDSFTNNVDLEWTSEILDGVSDIADYFGLDSQATGSMAGLYALTPDANPIIEETVPGFVNAVGFSGHGFMHAPATGQLVAEIVCDGEPSLVDIDALYSSRFEESATGEKSFI